MAKKKKTTAGVSKKTSKKASAKKGIIERINALFEKGHQTVQAIESQLKKAKVQYSLSTVRTQVGKLRKEHGLSSPREEGPIARITELFKSGVHTVPDMLEQLKAEGVDCSDATVRTQVGKLRREAGLTGKERVSKKAASKKTSKKKASTKKKTGRKKTTKKKVG